MDRKNRRVRTILTALGPGTEPMSSARVTALLNAAGDDASERTIRLYLQEMADQGLVESIGRRGCIITERGVQELRSSQILQRVGFLSAKIDQMTFCMTFDLATRAGDVIVNTSLVPRDVLETCVDEVSQVFSKGFAFGNRVNVLAAGEHVGNVTVPDGMVGFCTVCSVTLNGVLLKHGIPTRSTFGGLVEIRDGRAERFVEIIQYDGTTLDPLEIFIRGGMTDYLGAVRRGSGRIGASFREIPAQSVDLVAVLADRMEEIGLGAVLELGRPGQPVLDIPVSEGRAGAAIIGGLNPISIIVEQGYRCSSTALSGLMEYNRLFHFEELPKRLKAMA